MSLDREETKSTIEQIIAETFDKGFEMGYRKGIHDTKILETTWAEARDTKEKQS